jgi:hypothetical protein
MAKKSTCETTPVLTVTIEATVQVNSWNTYGDILDVLNNIREEVDAYANISSFKISGFPTEFEM